MKTKKYRWNRKKFAHNLGVLATMAALAVLNVWILYEWIMGA